MFEQKFLKMAVAEGGANFEGDYTPENRAARQLAFGIGMLAGNKDEFLAEGIRFLGYFDSTVLESIRNEKEGNNDQELIDAFRSLLTEFKQINRDVFVNYLIEDWDGRHEYN